MTNLTLLGFRDPVSTHVGIYQSCSVHTRILPDRTIPAVGVSGCHSAHLGAAGRVLIDVHDIMIDGEHRAFVHVSHCDFQGGGVFERTEIGKTRVRVRVHPLDMEGVGLLSLIVQRLLGISIIVRYDEHIFKSSSKK